MENVVESIRYAPGTFETKAYKEIHNAILSSSITYVEIEGAVRAGKDVDALNAYAEYLMLCPDKYHLVTHVNMDAAVKTVYEADGFGLKYLIPHGKKYIDNNHIVFRFQDWIGMEKEVHFFGLSQYNDHEKFRGMNYGSHYANEATRQCIDGLKNARDRTIASQWRKIIYTQNPISPSNAFYTEIEAPLMAKPAEVARINAEKEKYKDVYNATKQEFAIKEKERVSAIVKKFLFDHNKTSVDFLNKNDKLALRKQMLYEQYNVRKEREEYLFTNYGITSKHFVFYEGDENINNVKNGLNFRYIHLTMDSNPVITEARKAEIKDGYDVTSLHYKRDILGMRALADGAIYDNITNENYYYTDLPKKGLLDLGWERVLGIDYGVKNDFVILDSFISPKSKIIFVEDECRFKGNLTEDKKDSEGNVVEVAEKRPPTNELYIKMLKEMIAKRESGRYTALLYDPSARPFANTMAAYGIKCTRANNVVKRSKRVKELDLQNQDQKLAKETGGIMLVKTGIGLKKIRFNKRNCKDVVDEMEGYAYDPKKLQIGIEEPLKINDHGCIVGESLISTMHGDKPIKDITKGDILITMNEKTNRLEYDRVEECMLTGKNVEVYELELEDGKKLICTSDHKIFIKYKQRVKLCDIDINNDMVLTFDNENGSKIKSIKKIGTADVYNIQMHRNHNYFANNILISNCDVVRYIVNTRIKDDKTWLRASDEEVDFNELLQKEDIPLQEEQETVCSERYGQHFNLF